MNCCEKCFTSQELKSIIKSLNRIDNCNFCGSTQVHVYDLHSDSGIDELFNGILSIFKPASELLPYGYSRYQLVSIKDEFEKKWNIFNGFNSHKIHRFLVELLNNKFPDKIPLLDNQVGILEWMNDKYLNGNSVLKGKTWSEFVDYIKHENRFHTNHVNYEVLKGYLSSITITLEAETFFRARISNSEELTHEKMGAPPKELATAGRANSEGISHLYLASDTSTAVSEIRPSKSDSIYVGRFPLTSSIKVIDFKLLKNLDVFIFQDPVRYAINLETFDEINKAISKPVRSGDSKLDYLPTQFIVDFIKSLNETEGAGYEGIIFESTLSTSGYNLMIFNPTIVNCVRIEKHRVESLNYATVPIHI
ncbi:RES domain-containing protein [Paenibacillus sp. FSL K6-2524]|uniref:RES domain-containing protein n=1 Tax=Paenibacillus sp. FSL K6-2524 TaxID=2954516 RepID=UPI0030F6689C